MPVGKDFIMKHYRIRPFSLVELLIVIAIIVILAAISLPALSAARTTARKTRCLANQRNIGVYAYQYAYNHNQSLKVLSSWQTWYWDLLKENNGVQQGKNLDGNKNNYMAKEKKKRALCLTPVGLTMTEIFLCPSDNSGGTASYARNNPGGGGTMKWTNASTPDKSDSMKIVNSRLNDFRSPSDLILVTDRWDETHIPGQACNEGSGTRSAGENDTTNAFHLRREATVGVEGGRKTVGRHKGDAPILFVDGHATARDYLQTIPKEFHPKSETDMGKLNDLKWVGYAVGSWSDDPIKKKK